MKDNKTTIQDLKDKVKKFIHERDWEQFHEPKGMSMHIATEAAELMDILRWTPSNEAYDDVEKFREHVEQEVADIAYALFNFCTRCDIDLSEAMERKLKLTTQKYPVEKARGNRQKYTEFKLSQKS